MGAVNFNAGSGGQVMLDIPVDHSPIFRVAPGPDAPAHDGDAAAGTGTAGALRCRTSSALRRSASTVLAIAAMLHSGSEAFAAETGATNFPIGVNTAFSAVFPPAGATQLYNFNTFYDAGRYQANLGNPKPPNFHTFVFVQATRINHTWINLTPDITLGSGFAFNFIHQTIRVGNTSGNGGFQFANPALIPYNINFHVLPNLWVSHALNIFPNWGQYSRNDLVNSGPNFTSFVPEVSLTYLPTPAWEVSLDAWSGFNTRNELTRYQTGNEFNIDYLVGYRPLMERLPGLQLGLNGYVYTQWTDDAQNGARVGDGNRGRVFAVGPQVRYDIGHGGLLAKWQHEIGAQNRPAGDRIWFQFTFPL